MNIVGQSFDQAEELLDAPAEESTLVSTLLSLTSRHLLPDLLERVAPSDFYDPHLGLIWESAQEIHTRGDAVSKRTLLAQRDTPAIRGRIKALSGEPVSASASDRAAAGLVEMSKRRTLLDALKRAAEHAPMSSSYSEALHFASEQLAALSEGHMPDDARSFADALDRWQEWVRESPEVSGVIPTPWEEVNDLLAGGMHPGKLYVWAARPGDGKSIALLDLAKSAAEQGKPAIVFSVEMGETEVVSRLLASGARAEYGQITRRGIDAHNWSKIQQYAEGQRNMPLTIIDKADVTMAYIAARARTLKRTSGLDVIAVDYLQLLNTTSKVPRQEQVAQISRALKGLAKELDCAVVTACQLNRDATNGNRKPRKEDLRESGAIEQDADVVILLHHELQNDQPTGFVDLIVDKNRTGRQGSVSLPWRGYQARIGR